MPDHATPLRRALSTLVLVTGGLLLVLGGLVLFGWHADLRGLVQAHPAWAPVQHNTALAFLLGGTALLLCLAGYRRSAATAGTIVGLIGALTLVQYLAGTDLGIDQWLLAHDITVQTSDPGRMAPNTALGFLLAGLALALRGMQPRPPPAATAGLAASVAALGLVAAAGYLIGLETAYGWGALTHMAIQTAVGFLLLATGLLALAWRDGHAQGTGPFRWLPPAAMIGVLTATLLLWQALQTALAATGVKGIYFHHLILAFGVGLALALGLALHHIQLARTRAEAAERVRRELEQMSTEHHRAEDALRESEALLQATSSLARVGGWELDTDTLQVTWTAETHRIHGLPLGIKPPLDQAIGYFHRDDRPMLRAALDAAMNHATPFDLELRLIRASGEEIWTRATCQPEIAKGRVAKLRGAFQDINDRKRIELELRAREQLLQTAGRIANLGAWEVDLDSRIVIWSDQVCHIHGEPPGTRVPVERGIEYYAPEWRPRITEVYTACVERGEPYDEELQIINTRGERVWVRTIGEPVYDASGRIHKLQGAFQDISARKQAEEELRQAAMVFEHTHDGIIVTDAETRILSVNRSFSAITGYPASEAIGRTPALLDSAHQSPGFYRAMWDQLHRTGHWQGEIWNRRKNGEVYPEWLTINSVRNEQGEVTHYIGIFTDITAAKRSQEQLEYLAHHDTLTGLPNRVLFEFRLSKSIEHGRRHTERLAVLMIDLDRFKAINDSLGHSVGDELLTQIPDRLLGRLRQEDSLARLGGDEFGVLLEQIERPEDASMVAHDLIQRLAAPFTLPSGHEVFIGASVGISVFPDDGDTLDTMMRNADSAMYKAKGLGRNNYQYYTEDLTRQAMARLSLENRLRRALTGHEFVLHYQPFVRITDGSLIGAEALVRWQDPEHGLVLPGDFIAVAEDSGLIATLGEQVLQMACTQMQAWRHAGLHLETLAVNLSPQQFLLQDVPALLRRTLDASSLPAHSLELEITEGTLMQQSHSAVNTLEQLREIGVRLSIDDFGTGYSSLAYLKHFPIDKLKIDRSFVEDMLSSEDDQEIVTTIITLGHGLRLEVLAEGVEGPAQLEHLALLGCDSYQGYHATPPLSAEAFAEWVRTRAGDDPGNAD
ncbi:MAG: sensor domain-containing protein [Pseudomonadota bacterium]